MPKISIIIPVYNDGKYVERAIDSILTQTLDDIEIVCVNDGSTDNSLDVLKKLENQYDSIKVFSQENKGVAYARNLAMEKATGDYIGFLDADDVFIDNDCIEKMYNVAHARDVNMVTGNIFIWNPDGSFSDFSYLEYFTEEKVLLPEEYGIPFSFSKCIFKREFLEKHNIVFPLLTKGEDPTFLAEVLSKLDKFYGVPTDVYAYYYADGSTKYNHYYNYLHQITQYKLVFEYFSEPKFYKRKQEFRGLLIGFIDMMGVKGAKNVLKAIREVFCEDSDKEILHDCEEYFYFKYENNEELNELVKLNNDSENPRVSVVVPIFEELNDEFNLDCLSNQNFEDFDINIFTDKKSTDLENVIDFNDDKISVFVTDEKSFFNSVFDELKGEFVFFFNPKDNIKEKHLKELYKNIIANGSDLVLNDLRETHQKYHPNLFNFKKVFKVNFNRFNFDHNDAKTQVLNSFFTPNMALYRKSFLEKHFDEFKKINSEDFFLLFYLLKAKFISYNAYTNYEYSFDNLKNKFNDFKELEEKFIILKEFLTENNYFIDFNGMFVDFKVDFAFNHINVFKSEEFFNGFKEYLLESSEISPEFLGTKGKKFNNFLNSNTYHAYELRINKDKFCSDNKKLLKTNKKLKRDVKKIKNKKNKIIKSKSWKITKPLRFIKNL